MRLFQNFGIYESYRRRLRQLIGSNKSFAFSMSILLNDRYGACHILGPVLEDHPDAFFTCGDDHKIQRAWARENGLNRRATLDDILLAQIESHRTDVFYNLDPVRFGNEFVKRLPGSVRRTLAWRAAPSKGRSFGDYDLILNNFPSLLAGYRQDGMRAEYFTPAHDPRMDQYAANTDRPVDILFVGGFSRHHGRRTELLRSIAVLKDRYKVVFHLDRSKFTRLAESPLGLVGPLAKHRRPPPIRMVSEPPLFGVDLYSAIGRSKIVINGAIDMAGNDRGNMRCWEAMGCGALLLSDAGIYPAGMEDGVTLRTYGEASQALSIIDEAIGSSGNGAKIAAAGHDMASKNYSKALQWARFNEIAG